MGLPVTVVPAGGIAVTEALNGLGLPVSVVAAGGLAVTQVASGGLAVVGMDTGSSVGPNYRMRALAASFFLTGQNTTLTYKPALQYAMQADVGAFALNGASVTLTYTPVASGGSVTMQAGAGAFVFTGESMTPITFYSLTAQTGAFALAGKDATLTKTSVSSYTGPGDVSGWGTAYGYWGLRGYNSTKLSGTTKCLDVCSNASGAALNLTTVFIGSNGYVDLTGIGFSPIYIQRIYDQVGSQDLFWNTGNRSQLITNAVGGKPSISFTTAEFYSTSANAVVLAQPISMGTVFQTSSGSGIVMTDGTFNFQGIGFGSTFLNQYFGAGPFQYTTFATNTLSSVVSVANGATCTMWLNGTVMSPTTRNHGTNGIGTTNKLTIGGTDSGNSLWAGHLYEFIIKSGVVSDADKTALSTNQHAIGTGW
jgi:hypothetical protein